MKTTYKLTLILWPAACRLQHWPSQDTVQTAIAQTQAAQPSNTPPSGNRYTYAYTYSNVYQLTGIGFESILLVNGDLPTDYTGSVITDELPITNFSITY
jgi:hypothetical protein